MRRRMIDALHRVCFRSAYFHWSRGTCSLNATSAFISARLLQRGGNSNRGLDTARCEIRATTGASRAICRGDYSVRLSLRCIIRSFDPVCRMFDIHVRSRRLCHFRRSSGWLRNFPIIPRLLDPHIIANGIAD